MKKTARKGTSGKAAKAGKKSAVKSAAPKKPATKKKAARKTAAKASPKKTAKNSVKKAVKKAVKKTAKKVVGKASKKSVKKAIKKVTKAAVKPTAKKAVKKTAAKAAPKKSTKTKKAAVKAATKAIRKVAKKAAKKATKAAKTVKKILTTAKKPQTRKSTTAVVPPKKKVRPVRPKSFAARPVEKAFGFPVGIPDLPDAYGDNRLVLMTKDPEYLFAYWEITSERLAEAEKAKRKDEEYREALRLNWDARELLDTNFALLPVQLESRKWYMKVPYPGISYHVEIGWLSNQGHFIPILVSNPSDAPETWETTRLRLKNLKGMGADTDDVIDYHLRVTHPLGASEQGAVERIPVPKPARKELHAFSGPGSLSSSFGTKPQGSKRAPKARGPRT